MFCRFNYSQNEWIKEKRYENMSKLSRTAWRQFDFLHIVRNTVRCSTPLAERSTAPAERSTTSAERNTAPAECSTPSAGICSCLWSLWSYRWIWSQGYFRQQGFCHDLLSHGLYRHYCCTSRNQFIKVRNVPCKTGTENWGSFYLVYICSYNTVPRLDCIPDFTGYYMGNKDNFFLPDLLRQG